MIKDALEIAKKAHFGQKDKSGNDYFESHIIPVVNILKYIYNINDEEILCAGALHDTIEDTNYNEEALRGSGISNNIIDIVKTVTRDVPDKKYYNRIAKNEKAMYVKLADINSNIDSKRLNILSDKIKFKLVKKYKKAINMLTEFNSNNELIVYLNYLRKKLDDL